MSEDQDEEERPCLHCMMVELVDQFEHHTEHGEEVT
jgi:hypothetical protein